MGRYESRDGSLIPLNDINQYNASDKRLESRTNDLSTVLRLGR